MRLYRGNLLSLLRSLLLLCISIALLLITGFPCNLKSISQVSADSGGGWYQDGAPVITKKDCGKPNDFYPSCDITIASGSCTAYFTWFDYNSPGKCSGTHTGAITWTPPPAYLKPGDKYLPNLAAQTTKQDSCGDLGSSTWVSIEASIGGFGYDCGVRPPCSSCMDKSFTVPAGTAGQKLAIDVNCHPVVGAGYCTYNYVYKGSGTPPASTPPPVPAPPSSQTTTKQDELIINLTLPTKGSQLTKCQSISITGRIKRGEAPIAGADITAIIFGPGVKSLPINLTADSDGIFDWVGALPEKESLKWGIPPSKKFSVPEGDWHVSVVGTDKGDTAKAQSNFTVIVGSCLCDEARALFTESEMKNASFKDKLRTDYQDLRDSFTDGIVKYFNDTKRMPYKSDNIMGTYPALTWMFAYGGIVDTVSKQFVFNDPDNPMQKKGNEPSLLQSMDKYVQKTGKKLTPGDILYLALKERDGDMKEALLLAHNTLRSIGRKPIEGASGKLDSNFTGVSYNKEFCDRTFEIVREEDNMGPMYHMFGTAYFEMQSKGEWGPAMYEAAWSRIPDIRQLYDSLNYVIGAKTESVAVQPNVYSNHMNIIEQYYRQYKTGQLPDPEKYCINLWGVMLGNALYDKLGYASDADQYAKSDTEQATKVMKGKFEEAQKRYQDIKQQKILKNEMEKARNNINTILGNNPLPDTISGEVKLTPSSSHMVVLHAVKCPSDFIIADQNNIIMFSQSTREFQGYYPGLFIPLYEPDDSWGLVWFDDSESQHQQVLIATEDGTIETLRIDPYNGKVATYTAQVKKEEVLVMNIQPQQLDPPMKFGDGRIVTPVLSSYPSKLKPAGNSTSLPKCFIATAAYGSATAAELDTLRAFRDKVLLKSEAGKLFVDTYYYLSPPLAEFIAEHEELRTFVREALLDPVVTVLKGTQEIWDNR
ncbi:MAG: hypothetical protein NTZ34_00925 [Chloroflexi bacterium]|nr:hypothetical protein [Chloroflexota bacterium]